MRNMDFGPVAESDITVCVGITGHRAHNASFAANRGRIEAVLGEIFELIDAVIEAEAPDRRAPTRLQSMLADGVDQVSAEMVLRLGWKLVSPLPFGRALNAAINAQPVHMADARAILEGRAPEDPPTKARAAAILALMDKAHVFELADADETIARRFLAGFDEQAGVAPDHAFTAEMSDRVALASRVVIEQSDVVIAVWDGATTALAGGTGHTVVQALNMGAPVIWIDATAPERWRVLRAPESLASLRTVAPTAMRITEVESLIRDVLHPENTHAGDDAVPRALARDRWHRRSNPLWHGYRRIEALFGAERMAGRFRRLRQTYETPDEISQGSAAALLKHARRMPGHDTEFVSQIENDVVRRFAWFDGVSSRLSDNYRGGMVVNFLLAPLAITAGITYLPFSNPHDKWMFAIVEFFLLASILGITLLGQARRWHGRWFETRRVAEYLRHAPILLVLGVARSPGRWPRGVDASWPEWFSRQALRAVGLPRVAMTPGYLRIALADLLDDHVVRQRDYHIAKAKRLTTAHENLDRFSGLLFTLAVVTVVAYLALRAGGVLGTGQSEASEHLSLLFTFLAVVFPTFGGAVAGIRYFGDFERFAAISQVTAEKLDAVHTRIALLLTGPDSEIRYDRVAELARAADDIVVSEIENWQAVFGGKHITVPV